MQCKNCNATHNCTCKKRIASDGKECCTKCIGAYEASKKLKPSSTIEAPVETQGHQNSDEVGAPVIEKVTFIRT